MSDFEQLSAVEWRWKQRNTFYGVRMFPHQGTLIWSNWVETSEGPQFGQGARQTYEQFAAHGPPEAYAPPPALVEALAAAISTPGQPERRGWLGRLFGARGN